MLRALLYPLWDSGFTIGHALVSPKQAIARGSGDLDAATSLLGARFVWGDHELFVELEERRAVWLSRKAHGVARRLLDATRERHLTADRAGWALAPDLKDDIGGLRDINVAAWLAALLDGERRLPDELVTAGELLLAVREALHAEVRRKTDRLHMELQPRVAARLELEGDAAVDDLMIRVHSTARRVEHVFSVAVGELTRTAFGGPRRSGAITRLGGGVFVDEGKLEVSGGPIDVEGAVGVLAAHAHTGKPLSLRTLERLRDAFSVPPPGRWTAPLRDRFLSLLAGAHSPSALEVLDQLDGWRVLLPEWQGIRGRAQHDPYHRYTVDAHSFLAVEELERAGSEDPAAAAVAEEPGAAGSLRLAALLHDVGKGSGGDHSVAGEVLSRAACRRMGLDEEAVEEVGALVRNHLLLADTAARRDLDDGAVIEEVAKRVGTDRRLKLLSLLTVADARATGPGCWTEWRAALARELYRKVMYALRTGELPARTDLAAATARVESYEPALAGRAAELLAALPHSYLDSVPVGDMADELSLLARGPHAGEVLHRIDRSAGDCPAITVCVRDRPGVLARTAGVLALARISVLEAQAYSTTTGLALQRFVVRDGGPERWQRFENDLTAAYSGRLALDARLERQARDYHPGAPVHPDVRVLQDVSPHSTVVEVRAPDA
ncbi:MAG: HD domain-containing protein, partial [Actinomycetota bacterium]